MLPVKCIQLKKGNRMHLKILTLTFIALAVGVSAKAATTEDYMLSGSKYIQEKKYKEAARDFETAVQLAPDNADANRLLGLSLAKLGDLDRAAQYSEKAASLKPNYAVYYILGLIYANQSSYGKAETAYGKALEQNPKSYEAWHQLGKVHATTLSFDKAIEAYSKAVSLNSKFPDAYQGLASAKYWANDLTGALQQVDELNRLGFKEKAQELERWLKDKEAKKKKAEKKAAAAS
jgi:tetratricopeptide (TPR) repeat protein